MKGTAQNYGRFAQLLHWLSAILIIGLWPMGFLMVRMGETATQTALYQVHVAIGLLVTLLTITRIIWHFVDEVPAPPAGLTSTNRKLFQWTHNFMYIILLVLAVSGVAILISSGLSILPGTISPQAIGDTTPSLAHSLLSKIFVLLLIAHVGGVVRYQLTKGNTMSRMGIGRPTTADEV